MPSARGNLEIADEINIYLSWGEHKTELLGREFACLYTGVHYSLLKASTYMETIEKMPRVEDCLRGGSGFPDGINRFPADYKTGRTVEGTPPRRQSDASELTLSAGCPRMRR
jgi:hypothetical protein